MGSSFKSSLDDLRKLEHSEQPPEVKKVVEEIKLQAQRAGEQVARDLNVQTQPKSPKRASRPAGLIKLGGWRAPLLHLKGVWNILS
jgi:hypothetical protein